MRHKILAPAMLLLPALCWMQESFAQKSPLVLETVFPVGDPSQWKKIKSMERFAPGVPLGLSAWPKELGKETSIPEWYALGRYSCDGVYLREEVKKHGTEWEEPGLRVSELKHLPNGKFEITLEATLYNPEGNGDRLVTLAYDVLDANGATIQAAQRTYKLEAKAKSGENADVLLLATPDDLRRISRLRMTITTTPY